MTTAFPHLVSSPEARTSITWAPRGKNKWKEKEETKIRETIHLVTLNISITLIFARLASARILSPCAAKQRLVPASRRDGSTVVMAGRSNEGPTFSSRRVQSLVTSRPAFPSRPNPASPVADDTRQCVPFVATTRDVSSVTRCSLVWIPIFFSTASHSGWC